MTVTNTGLGSGVITYVSIYSNRSSQPACSTPSDKNVWVYDPTSFPAGTFRTYSVTQNAGNYTNQTQLGNYWTMSTSGSFTAGAYVDSFCSQAETNEFNNFSAYSYTTIPGLNTVLGRVFVDTNGNGVEDLGEVGFSGATVTASGPTLASTTTNGSLFPSPNYSLVGLTAGTYTITLTVPAGYTATTLNPRSGIIPPTTVNFGIVPLAGPTSTPTPTPTPIPGLNTISGNVFVDNIIENCAIDPGESGYSLGTTVNAYIQGGPLVASTTTNGSGNYSFSLGSGTYQILMVEPPGYTMAAGKGNSVSGVILPPNTSVPFCIILNPPTPTSIPTYSISGNIFTDTNANSKKDPTEPNYTGAINISVTNGFAGFSVSNSSGNYSSNNLPQGQYTVTFSGLPPDKVFTYPLSSLIVQVGPGCFVPVTSEAMCSGNSIINLNAGVTANASAWFQSIGSDMRWDSGFTDALPSSKFASIFGTGGMPGIIFSGSSSPNFGQGSASQSPFNWKVGSFANPDFFTDTHNLIPTSYRFLLETVDSSAITKKGVTDLCSGGSDPTNCTLTPVLLNGVYKIDGNLNLNGSRYTFPGGKDFVILINGNLTINEKILVPIGSTVIFSATGNITVNRAIGEGASSAASTIEGLYSADGNFVADGNKNCSIASDLRLNVAGTVIANAGRGGGTFVNNRDLCTGNSSFPSVSFIERPDFMLNYPSLVQSTTRAWQEVAP